VDGQLVIDNWTRQRRARYFLDCSSEERGTFQAKAGTKHEIFVKFFNVDGSADGDEEEGVQDMYVISLWIIKCLVDRMPLLKNQDFVLGVLKFETQTNYFKRLLI
jgi:PA14 domain